MKLKNLLFVLLIILFSITVSSRELTIDYNNALTRSIGDVIYCKINGDCTLNNIYLTGNISFLGSIINVTIINQNITGILTVDGNLKAQNITVSDKLLVTNCTIEEVIYGTTGNCVNLNDTIESHLASTTFYPTQFATVYGTESGGNNIGNLSFSDDETFNITEAAGGNALLFYVNFTGVSEIPNFLCLGQRYFGTHYIEVDVWSYSTSSWENYESITATPTIVKQCLNLVDGENHISSEKVQVRFEHPSNGRTQDKLLMDFVQIVHGFGVTSTEEMDPFSIHKNGVIPWEGNEQGNGYNSTGWNLINATCFGGLSWNVTISGNEVIREERLC